MLSTLNYWGNTGLEIDSSRDNNLRPLGINPPNESGRCLRIREELGGHHEARIGRGLRRQLEIARAKAPGRTAREYEHTHTPHPPRAGSSRAAFEGA